MNNKFDDQIKLYESEKEKICLEEQNKKLKLNSSLN